MTSKRKLTWIGALPDALRKAKNKEEAAEPNKNIEEKEKQVLLNLSKVRVLSSRKIRENDERYREIKKSNDSVKKCNK